MRLSKTVLKIIVATIVSLSMTGVASAAFITGKIALTGTYTPIDINGNPSGSNLIKAAGFEIDNAVVAGGTVLDIAAEGVSAGDAVNHSDFYFDPAGTPITPLWTTTTGTTGQFSFDVQSMVIDLQRSFRIALSGRGVLRHPSFDDTEVLWGFSASSFGSGTLTWSSFLIPEPSILPLLGLGLLGFIGGRRMNKAK